MTTDFDLGFDGCMDSALDAVSEVQALAAKLAVGKPIDPWKLYEQACRIEYALDLLREYKQP